MWIALSWVDVLCRRYERGNFDLDLRALIDQVGNVEQRRGREVSPQRLAPGCTDAGTSGLIFAATGQIPNPARETGRNWRRLPVDSRIENPSATCIFAK